MPLANTPGAATVDIGPNIWNVETNPAINNSTLDATNEGLYFIGHCVTSDGGSHTINTTGSSAIGFRTGAVTFAQASSVFKVGIGAVDTTVVASIARPVNAADVVTMDVAAVLTGGGLTTTAWNELVPTTGTKTIANGDLIAISFQFTNRVASDSIIIISSAGSVAYHVPIVTSFLSGVYAAVNTLPNAIIKFADGALGWIFLSEIRSAVTTLTFDNNDTPSEYGQLYNLPFGIKIYGLYGWCDIDADAEFVLYSDPLGTPVAEKSVVLDSSVRQAATPRRHAVYFSSPYTYTKNTNIAAVYKPTTTSTISCWSKTLSNAAYRVADVWGTSGYGVSRAGGSGAFANINSSLDSVYAGLICGAFDDGAGAGGGGGLNVLGRGGVIS